MILSILPLSREARHRPRAWLGEAPRRHDGEGARAHEEPAEKVDGTGGLAGDLPVAVAVAAEELFNAGDAKFNLDGSHPAGYSRVEFRGADLAAHAPRALGV